MQFIDISDELDDLKPPSNRKPGEALPIEKDTNLGELAAEYPHLAETLQEDYGLHCVGCFASAFDTLEMGMKVHGYEDQEIEEAIARLKKIHDKQLRK